MWAQMPTPGVVHKRFWTLSKWAKNHPNNSFPHLLQLQQANAHTVELQWLEHLWNHENMFETGVVVNHSARSGGIIKTSFPFSLIWRYVVWSHWNRLIEAILMSTHNIRFSILLRKSPLIIPNLLPWDFFSWTQEQVQNCHSKQAICVWATKFYCKWDTPALKVTSTINLWTKQQVTLKSTYEKYCDGTVSNRLMGGFY